MTEPAVLVDWGSVDRGARRVGKWLFYWASLLACAGTAFLMAVLASDTGAKHRWWYAGVGVVCSLLVLVLPALRAHALGKSANKRVAAARSRAEEAELRARVAEARAEEAEASGREATELAVELQARFNASIGDVISPIANELAGLACGTGPTSERRGAVIQQIVDAAVTLCGGDGVRASLYVLGRTTSGKSGDLVRWTYGGRHDTPRERFRKRGDARERAVHALVTSGSYDLQDDVLGLTERNLYRGKHYRSLVAVAISAGARPRGMIAVDAKEVARFDRTHLGILLALAGLAAIALDAQVASVADEVQMNDIAEG